MLSMNTVQEHSILQTVMFVNSIFRKVYYIGVSAVMFTLILSACSDTDTLNKPTISYEMARPQIDTLMKAQRFEEAYMAAKDVLPEVTKKFDPNSEELASLYNILSVSSFHMRQYPESRLWAEKELQIRQKIDSPTDEVVLTALNNIGNTYYEEGKYKEVLPIALDIKKRREQKGKTQSNDYAITVSNVGRVLVSMNRFLEAEPYLVEAVNLFQKVPDSDIEQLSITVEYLWTVYNRLDDYDRAIPIADYAIRLAHELFGDEHYRMAIALRMKGMTLLYKRDPKAEQNLQRSYTLYQKLFPPNSIEIAIIKRDIGWLYMSQDKDELADQSFREALEIARKIRGEEHPNIIDYLTDYGHFLVLTQEYSKAAGMLKEALLISDKNFGKDSPTAIRTLEVFIQMYKATGEQVELNIAAEQLRIIQERMKT